MEDSIDSFEAPLRKAGAFFIGRTVYIVSKVLVFDPTPDTGSRLEYNFLTREAKGYTWKLTGYTVIDGKTIGVYETIEILVLPEELPRLFDVYQRTMAMYKEAVAAGVYNGR